MIARELLADRIGGHYEAALAAAPTLVTEVDAGLSRAATAETAAAWLDLAAEHALSLGARDAAVDLLRRSLALTTPDAGVAAGRRMIRLATTLAASGDLGEALRLAERSEAIQRAAFRQTELGSDDHARARDDYARASDARADVEAEQLHFLEAAPSPRRRWLSSKMRTTSPGRACACGAHGRWRFGTTPTTPPRSRMS